MHVHLCVYMGVCLCSEGKYIRTCRSSSHLILVHNYDMVNCFSATFLSKIFEHAFESCVAHVEITCMWQNAYNSYLTVIGVHEMHGPMHHNYSPITIFLVVDLIGLLYNDLTSSHSWQIAYKHFGC